MRTCLCPTGWLILQSLSINGIQKQMDRRRFIRICGITAAVAGLQARYDAAEAVPLKPFNRVQLVDAQGQPIKAQALSASEAYIFHYPYTGTPCFLINLPAKPQGGEKLVSDNGEYTWEGGAGPNGTIVAMTAICPHQLTYPTRKRALINYYANASSEIAARPGVIVCCEHERVYDPAQGGKMIATGKKATQPLASIRLEHDPASDSIYAIGVYGGARFDDFFRKYKKKLLQEYGPGEGREEAAGGALTLPMREYTEMWERC